MAREHRFLRWVEHVAVTVGLAALAWCGLVLLEAHEFQRLALAALETMPAVVEPVADAGRAGLPAKRVAIASGTPLAELQIPRLHLSAVVLEGSDARTLRLGPGHIEETARPGQSGNVGIAGHRDTIFRSLGSVHVGDDILLNTPHGRSHYVVSWVRIVSPSDVSVLDPTSGPALTLITCYPFGFLGQAPRRFIVRATHVEDRVAVASTSGSERGAILREARDIHSNDAREADDDALVRAAVEHFRLTYNARLAGHGAPGLEGLVTFRFCAVAVAETIATANCTAASPEPESLPSPVWTFQLDKIGRQWTITSVGA